MNVDRIKRAELIDRLMTPEQAAALIKDKMVVASSGFTKSGDSKAVLPALAERAKTDPLKITLMTGASLGYGTDGELAASKALSLRLPFQVDPILRKAINSGEVMFIDQHLGETANQLRANNFPKIDIAIIEVAMVEEDGSLLLTTSVGNSSAFALLANKIILEVNLCIPLDIIGLHDIFSTGQYPNRSEIPILAADTRVGTTHVQVDPDKIVGIVITNKQDSPAEISPPDETTVTMAQHLVNFFDKEVKKGNLSKSLLPLQAGIGKVANAVLDGFRLGDFENLTMYSEVLQDSTFDLLDSGKMTFASGSSITVSEEYYDRIFNNLNHYKDKIVLRPQSVSNAAEVIRRLGVITLNTALECDIYGNVNSTHVTGINMMNGIGGSGDFSRNAYLSVFVTQSLAKGGKISSIVPMVSHVDHTEHDVDVIVTEQGLADLRGLAPRQRAQVIIDNCVHPAYRSQLQDYFDRALERGGQTPHLLEEAFSWHIRLRETGTMKLHES